mgnify:CR=1 FL=1
MSDTEQDIFEKTFGSLRPDEINSSESEKELEEKEEVEQEIVEEKPKKKPRKKREMTPERKAKLLENLKKGRETAKLNRQKKAKAKK